MSDVWLHPAAGTSPYSGSTKGLFPWTLAKAFLSSPAALRESVRERIKRLDVVLTVEQKKERDALNRLLVLAETSLNAPSAKYTKLLDYLRGIGVGPRSPERTVIFSERVATLHWLRAKITSDLKMNDDQVRVLHGGLSDTEQQEIVESFKQSSSPIRVLITGDVASEGVNLHSQCHELIHFDIPWSLIRIEQRNGRIDRYGQRHRPQISTLLLSPTSDAFSGDVRVLQRLLEREQEAHAALGDAASLMGQYDVGAEEDLIRQALAGSKNIDDIVPTVDHALEFGDSIGAMLARIAKGEGALIDTSVAVPVNDVGTGLFASSLDYLREALTEIYGTPGASVAAGGVNWREDASHGTVQFTPGRDLVQRLAVLPQAYLADRHVTERLILATTKQRAKAVLSEAVNDPASTSLWPEAHYLSPMHPVLEWASDRALGRLGRNEIFAVVGDVDLPTVLLVGTVTNRRGHVVATSFMTAVAPDTARPTSLLLTAHASASDALDAAGILGSLVNAGHTLDLATLQSLVGPAVEQARLQMESVAQAASRDVDERVSEWSDRVERWQREADAMTQLPSLRTRRTTVEQERKIADSMKPNARPLVRPLLVVVPRPEMD